MSRFVLDHWLDELNQTFATSEFFPFYTSKRDIFCSEGRGNPARANISIFAAKLCQPCPPNQSTLSEHLPPERETQSLHTVLMARLLVPWFSQTLAGMLPYRPKWSSSPAFDLP